MAEVRAVQGDLVALGKFETLRTLRIIDLAYIPYFKSPFERFSCSLFDEVKRRRILRMLSEDLSRPYKPELEQLEYLPTQYLAESIRELGFDGVRFW